MGSWNRVLGLSCLLLLSACTSVPDAVPAATPAPDPDQLLWGGATLLQEADGEPELCLGPVLESYPPQCGGPTVVGLDWDAVEDVERAAGVTWGSAYVVGTYDGSTFTLDRPPSASRPDGVPEPSPVPDQDYPRLCEDPYRGGDRSTEGDQAALGEALEDLDGYVTSYVSDGVSMFNVLVTGSAEEAHAELRRVWSGGLCVVQRDLPTQEATRAARDALSEDAEDLGLISVGGMGVDGVLHVDVMVADAPTVAMVHERVARWLRPEQVVVNGALEPLPG